MFVVPTTDFGHATLPLFIQSIGNYFCGHIFFLIESSKFVFDSRGLEIVHFFQTLPMKNKNVPLLIKPVLLLHLQTKRAWVLPGYNLWTIERALSRMCSYLS